MINNDFVSLLVFNFILYPLRQMIENLNIMFADSVGITSIYIYESHLTFGKVVLFSSFLILTRSHPRHIVKYF